MSDDPEQLCPKCEKPMKKSRIYEIVAWGDYPGTGQDIQVWWCDPCQEAVEKPIK